MIKTKNLKYYSCTFFYDKERNMLSIDLFKKDKKVYTTTFNQVTTKFVNKFIKNFDDKEAKEINSLEMENL
jgi:hypothetical protein